MTVHNIPALNKAKPADASCDKCRFLNDPTPRSQYAVATPGYCGVYGKPVDVTIMTREEVARSHENHATGCKAYLNQVTTMPQTRPNVIPVAFSMVDAPEEIDSVRKGRCTNCANCINFVPPAFVEGFGFFDKWAMCAVKGALLAPTQLGNIARTCDQRMLATSADDFLVKTVDDATRALVPYPHYNILHLRAQANSDQDAEEAVTSLPANFDPAKYINGPIAQEDWDAGIRTWVPVRDPYGFRNQTLLPIFRADFFSAEEQSKIPQTGDDEHPESYVDYAGLVYDTAVGWRELDMTPTLEGPPGVGKTELGRHMAWIMGLPFERMSITNSSELGDLQGEMRFENGETRFHPGRVVTSWQKPCVLLIDEPNVGPRDVWHFLRPLTDNSKQLVVDAWNGQPIKRNDNTYLMLAMNPAWDMKNDGANDLADADIRRLMHLDVPYPPEDIEREIIMSHCKFGDFDIPKELLDSVISVGRSLRALADQLPISWGMGMQIKVALLLKWFAPVAAYNRAGGNYLEPDVRQLFLTEVQATFQNG